MMSPLAVGSAVFAAGCAHDPPAPASPSAPHDVAAAPAHHGGPHAGGHEGHEGHQGHGMPHRFTDAPRWAAVFDDPARDAWQKPDEVVKALGLKPDDTVADLGAGTGYFTLRLARAVPKGVALGVDVEPEMVAWLEARAQKAGLTNVKGVVCPPDDAALPAGVDVVLVVDTYHHISDRVPYFKKVAAQLAPGGRLAIVDFTGTTEKGPPPAHRILEPQVVQELAEAGFVEAERHAFLPDQFFLVFTKR